MKQSSNKVEGYETGVLDIEAMSKKGYKLLYITLDLKNVDDPTNFINELIGEAGK